MINRLLIIITILLQQKSIRIQTFYNPIPYASIIVSTTRTISVIQPKEFSGNDQAKVIYTATYPMTIVHTIYDPFVRSLSILFNNGSDNHLYLSQLKSVDKLDSTIYKLPISFNISNINRLTSFTSDISNQRAFLTDQTGSMTIFSLSGSMKTIIEKPSTINGPIRSVIYSNYFNRLYLITDFTVNSCAGLDDNQLHCCQDPLLTKPNQQLRSITFEPLTSHRSVYVIDATRGIYQVTLDELGCPLDFRLVQQISPNYFNIHLAAYANLFVCSGSSDESNHNSVLLIGSTSKEFRPLPMVTSIVAIHISAPKSQTNPNGPETCFGGITYNNYRLVGILAAIFGTIMGLFMCFNALFCVDFFMTKRIIRDLKQQIPHDLLEDRWTRLVEEKYAKIALELHRKKNDPLPSKAKTVTTVPSTATIEARASVNPIPKLSAYIRQKSESYISRRRSEDYRYHRHAQRLRTLTRDTSNLSTTALSPDDKTADRIQENTSEQELVKNMGEML